MATESLCGRCDVIDVDKSPVVNTQKGKISPTCCSCTFLFGGASQAFLNPGSQRSSQWTATMKSHFIMDSHIHLLYSRSPLHSLLATLLVNLTNIDSS